jgi:hypothetical protein
MRIRIARYTNRSAEDREDFRIGCRIPTQPFSLPDQAWIPVGEFWPRNVVSFNTDSKVALSVIAARARPQTRTRDR